MLYYPTLTELESSRDFIEAFGGYNHNLRIGDGEFYDMKNLTSSYYPVLAPRKPRGIYKTIDKKPLALIEKDALCYVTRGEDNHIYFNMSGLDYDLGLTTIITDEQRSMVSMGAYVIVMPDKLYINTADTDDRGKIEVSFTTENRVEFSICKADGEAIVISHTSSSEPGTASNGAYWLDTSVTPYSLKQYSSISGMWASVATTYVRIQSTGIGAAFNEYDGVTISGIFTTGLEDLTGTMAIQAKGDNYIVVVGILNSSIPVIQENPITVTRKMPDMDFIIESNNRLWGCRYGLNATGEIVNELYACKQGDFKNWNCFLGISTDSYYVSLGTDGPFTGAATYLGYPTFFKENNIHTVYGNYPAEYQVQDIACRGVQRGSHGSLAMVNEVLYYKSRTGVCAYSGSLPVEISSAFGEKAYTQAIACGYRNKYYISMKDMDTNKFELFVYDSKRNLWHKEDEFAAECFCPLDDDVYYIDGGVEIKSLLGRTGIPDTKLVKWMAETGVMGCSAVDKKYISRISIRLSMEIGARVRISVQYDSNGNWEQLAVFTSHTLRTFTAPVRPKRCDHLRLRIEGEGDVKIYSISKTVEIGSDL